MAQKHSVSETVERFEVARTKVGGLEVVENERKARRQFGLYSRAYQMSRSYLAGI